MEPKYYDKKKIQANLARLSRLAEGEQNVAVKPRWQASGPELNQGQFYHNKEDDFAFLIGRFNVEAEAMESGFHNIPYIQPGFGRTAYLMAVAYGCEPIFIGNVINAKPRIDSAEGIAEFKKIDNIHEHGFYPELLSRTVEIQERWGDLPFIPSDTQSPIDLATEIVHTEPLMLAMFDQPEPVHRYLSILTESTVEYLKHEKTLVKNGIGWNSDYPFPKGVHFSDDNAAFLSPQTYRDFARPYIEECSDIFGGVTLHCCMGYQQNIEVMAETRGFIGFDPQPAYNPEDKSLRALTGKGFWRIWDPDIAKSDGAAEEYKRLIDLTEGKTGLMLEINSGSRDRSLAVGAEVLEYADKKGRL
ncbi:MAG: uroporphyrinogen decarboxylase family protein [Spirochaetia bacterium]